MYWGSGYVVPRILNLGTKWRGVVSLKPRPDLYTVLKVRGDCLIRSLC